MTLQQGLVFGILAAMMVLFVWDRIRYDLVAMLGLIAAVAAGLVKPGDAFKGFSDDVVVIVGAVLVVSAAVGRSDLLRRLIRAMEPRMRTTGAQVVTLTGAVTLLSVFMKNIGALAIFLPIAVGISRRSGTRLSALLMPMAFGSLVGGLVTLVGTSPNILVARARAEMTGQPFGMFDYTPVGLGIALAAMVFLALGWRLLGGAGRREAEAAEGVAPYLSEARVPERSPFVGQDVAAVVAAADGEVAVIAFQRAGERQMPVPADLVLRDGDLLVLRGEPDAIRGLIAEAGLELNAADRGAVRDLPTEAVGVVEAVVMPASPLVGRTPQRLRLRDTHGVNLLAIARKGRPVAERLKEVRLRVGDVLMLQGAADTMPTVLRDLGCLAFGERSPATGRRRTDWLPVLILAAAMGSVALGFVPVPFAFFAAAVAVALTGVLTLREAYESLDLPILVLLACLIPISDAVSETGGAALIASGLAAIGAHLPAVGALVLVLLTAMALTPFLNNAATALIMAPVAVQMARQLGLHADPLLMAVAVGCACDFLTPVGHQCNTLVMGPGGYRFGDYARLGAPLSLIVVLVATLLIPIFWPLR
ncbi:SLC13 family permease [Roseomonas sp. CCTCC AB2023176]|uniref:SLC13 family permease n=1 Tax=Roseomonas sp. CCTCC AB2023176 TaxID=3342640 RepID=UPI0035DBDC48